MESDEIKEQRDKQLEVPKSDVSDHLHNAAKAIVSMIPIIGGSAVEIFNSLITPPIEKRRNQWMSDVASVIKELERTKGVTIDSLQSNEEFISILQEASLMAIKTHQQQKREHLKNGLLNSVTNGLHYEQNAMFLTLINDLTVTHVTVLKEINRLKLWEVKNIYQLSEILNNKKYSKSTDIIHTMRQSDEVSKLHHIIIDLKSKDLLTVNDVFGRHQDSDKETENGLPYLMMTHFGDDFLKFIDKQMHDDMYDEWKVLFPGLS